MTDTDLFLRTGAALAIGLLVGMERGWQSRGNTDRRRAAGLRTFGLTGLLGAITAHLALAFGGIVYGISFAAFASVFALFHWLEARSQDTASATTAVAGLLTFGLGAMAVAGNVQLAVAGAVAATVLLSLRQPLHTWIASVSWEEIKAGLILLVMTFLLLPVLPNRTVDPWGALNPHEIWLLAVMIAFISMSGYVAIRLFGGRLGIIVTAAAGGLASSTATTLTLSRMARSHQAPATIIAGGITITSTVMLVRVGAIAAALNPQVALLIWPPLVAGAVVLALSALVLIRMTPVRPTTPSYDMTHVTNPLELSTTLRFVALMTAIMLAVTLVGQSAGNPGLLAVAAISGLADVDAITISLSRTPGPDTIAAQGILVAVMVNSVTKAALAGWIAGPKVGAPVFLVTALAVAAGAGVYQVV